MQALFPQIIDIKNPGFGKNVKCSGIVYRIANLYFNGRMKCEEIGKKLGVTRQLVSYSVCEYIKRKGIKFFDNIEYTCKVCGCKWYKRYESANKTVRIDIEKTIKGMHGAVCVDCKDLLLCKCNTCSSVGYPNVFAKYYQKKG